MISYEVTKEHEGLPLFELLEVVYPDFSIKNQERALKYGDIDLNEEPAYGDEPVAEGDIVDIYLCGDLVGVDLEPTIVYQDENFVIVDKPAGLESISDYEGDESAVTKVEEMMKKQGEYNIDALMVPYLVYRLDPYESGLLIMAKHEEGYLFMIEALNQRRICRHYLCPVIGLAQEEDELLAYYKKNKAMTHAKVLSKFEKDAKPIVTRYKRLSMGETMSLLIVRPVTSGLHQVRAHLAYYGLPVLGDNQYGNRSFNKKAGADQIALCLQSIIFETGTNHEYQYLNGMRFDSSELCFPKSVYDEGLMDL